MEGKQTGLVSSLSEFAIGKSPLRIDVWIPDQHEHPPGIREVLESTSVMMVDSDRMPALAVPQHIIRALQYWSTTYQNFADAYMAIPFGSRIIVDSIQPNVRDIEITFLPNYEVERQWLSVTALQSMWQLPQSAWPRIVDISEIQFVRQIHEAVTLVKLPDREGFSEIFVFKALVNDVKHMYHELKVLLTLPPHLYIIPRPFYVATKRCRFGGKNGVCGFVLPYLPQGTLQSTLRKSDYEGTLNIHHTLRWARQATSVLTHIRESPTGFYSNLKLNNILMTSSSGSSSGIRLEDLNISLIDFEQRTSWYSWTPPEVSYVEYLDYLASNPGSPPSMRAYYGGLLQSTLPAYCQRSIIRRYQASDAPKTYSAGWSALTASEQAFAQVYMLGMLFWCLFEGCPTLNNFITVETFRDEYQEMAFPEFRRTPPALQGLIRKCTVGAREWKCARQPLIRVREKVYPIEKTGRNGEITADAAQTQEIAREWWKGEVEDAEDFVKARFRARKRKIVGLDGGEEVLAFMTERPSLEEVMRTLEQFGASI